MRLAWGCRFLGCQFLACLFFLGKLLDGMIWLNFQICLSFFRSYIATQKLVLFLKFPHLRPESLADFALAYFNPYNRQAYATQAAVYVSIF